MNSAERYLSSLREATLQGSEAVLAAASKFLAQLAGSEDAAFISPVNDSWAIAPGCSAPAALVEAVRQLPKSSHEWDKTHQLPVHGFTFVPVRPGSLAVVIGGVLEGESEIITTTAIAAQMSDLLLKDAERIDSLKQLLDEVAEPPNLPFEILSVRDLDQLLLSSVNTALQLVEADMAGVFLLEEGELVMRSCVGHRTAQTAHLRMKKGQGLAGQVLERGEPCTVSDYLSSDLISHDFDNLAKREDAHSALAAPLAIEGTIIGILEVWSRRPAVFHESHVRRIIGVAKLVSIAINNANLFSVQQRSYRELSQAQDSLQGQLSAIQRARSLQRSLSQLLLEGRGLAEILHRTSVELSALVVVFSNDFEVMAAHPTVDDLTSVTRDVQELAEKCEFNSGELQVLKLDDRWAMLQEVSAGQDQLGWFYLSIEYEPDMGIELAIGEAFLHSALCQVIQRTADYVRSSEREEILWDLIEGSAAHRLMAIDRSKWLRIQLARPQRVLRAILWDAEKVLQKEGWDAAHFGQVRHRLLARIREVIAHERAGDLVALRGNELSAIVPFTLLERVRRLVDDLNSIVSEFVPNAHPMWGVSSICEKPLNLGRANAEANTAVRAAQRLETGQVASYDELGVVRLFVAPEGDDSIRDYVDDVLGNLIEHDRKRNGSLIETVRVYFEVDCSQQRTAEKLLVHHKTVRYRLNRIEELTGLDLSRHENRMKVDLALKVHAVMKAPNPRR